METIKEGYPRAIIEETESLVTRYNASCDPNAAQSTLKLRRETQTEPLGRFTRSGEASIRPGERLEPDLAYIAALVVASKVHSQFEGISAILSRLSQPASHSAVVLAERHLLEIIGYDLVGTDQVVVL